MRRIDKETRTRFEDTFERINAGLREKFPRLFGGGHAYLELVGDDKLTAGVAVMARPPGKKNSTIHLLSGGEKALTAVALVFSIFDLNPAPFCLLDEVDAPLDEHNVGRFCDIVREMSARVQFIFITHNKTTMELASQLIGVTMTRAGRVAPGDRGRRRSGAARGGLKRKSHDHAELRWILLGICLVLYGALVWWERRRPRQASGSAGTERSAAPREFSAEASLHVRTEPALTLPTMRAREPGPPHELPVVEAGSARSHAGAQEEPAGDSPTDEVAALAGAASAAPAVVEETFEYVPKAEPTPRASSAPPPATARGATGAAGNGGPDGRVAAG